MRNVTTWQQALLTSWAEVWSSFLTILPAILGAILIFAIGLIIAFWLKRLIAEILRAIQLEKLSKSLGIDEYLKKADIKLDLPLLIGVIVEWLIILVFFLAAVDILGLTAVSAVLTRVLGYIPNVIAAALIFAAGYFVAGLVDNLVRGALVSVGKEVAKPAGRLAKWVVLITTFFAAVDQLQVARGLINTFFQGLTYTIVLVVGLSVGLGSKDLVSRVLNDWYDKLKK